MVRPHPATPSHTHPRVIAIPESFPCQLGYLGWLKRKSNEPRPWVQFQDTGLAQQLMSDLRDYVIDVLNLPERYLPGNVYF